MTDDGRRRRNRPLVSPDAVRDWAASQRVELDSTGAVPESVVDRYLDDRAAARPATEQTTRATPVALVVDDEEGVREWLRLSLSLEGWAVAEATTGEEAVEQWRRTSPDVILLDHRLPGMTGLECAAQLRGLTSDTRIIMFSAYLDPEGTKEARRLRILPLSKGDRTSLFQVLQAIFDEVRSSHRATV